MSYIVKLPRDKKCAWYHNSVNYYNTEWRERGGKSIDLYEKMFNIKLSVAYDGSVTEIEFPSEADATMFMLRWS